MRGPRETVTNAPNGTTKGPEIALCDLLVDDCIGVSAIETGVAEIDCAVMLDEPAYHYRSARQSIVPALPFCHFAIQVAKPQPESYPKHLKTLGDHIRICRLNRRFYQRQVAQAIGVHPLTITNWELNVTTPLAAYLTAIVGFLGYDPFRSVATDAETL